MIDLVRTPLGGRNSFFAADYALALLGFAGNGQATTITAGGTVDAGETVEIATTAIVSEGANDAMLIPEFRVDMATSELNRIDGTLITFEFSLPLIGGGSAVVQYAPISFRLTKKATASFRIVPWQEVNGIPFPAIGYLADKKNAYLNMNAPVDSKLKIKMIDCPDDTQVTITIPGRNSVKHPDILQAFLNSQ